MTHSLTHGKVAKTLIRLTSPSVLGLFAVISINLVDTYFISQIGMKELAAVTFALPLVMFVMNGSVGLSIGAGSVISRTIGRGEKEKGASITTAALILSVLSLSLVMLLGLRYQAFLFTFMGASSDLMPPLLSYMEIWFYGLPLLAVPMLSNTALTAHGDTKWPALIMCSAALCNFILDPLLIFGLWGFPKLGVEGASIATVISYGAGCFVSLLVLMRRKLLVSVPFERLREIWGQILAVGIPAAATQMMIPVSNAGSLWILSGLGAEAVAAYGVVCRLESFALVMVIALGSSVAAFSGQNFGAQQFLRVKEGLKTAYGFSLFWGAFLASISFLFAEEIASIFSNDKIVVDLVMRFLKIVPLTYGVLGFCFLASAFFNAIGSPLRATFITLFRHFVLYLPLAFLGMKVFGVMGVFYALFVVNLTAGIFAALFSFYRLKKVNDLSFPVSHHLAPLSEA